MRNAFITSLVALCLLGLIINRPLASAQAAPAAQRWEYGRLLIYGVNMAFNTQGRSEDPKTTKMDDVLAKLGANGLELVGEAPAIPFDNIQSVNSDAKTTLVFKRPLH